MAYRDIILPQGGKRREQEIAPGVYAQVATVLPIPPGAATRDIILPSWGKRREVEIASGVWAPQITWGAAL